MFLTCNNFPDKICTILLEFSAFDHIYKIPKKLKFPKVIKYSEKLLRI